MKHATTFLTQSRYYSPAFNAAIFDGPVRIYFAQYQEALALRIYFRLQERFKESFRQAKSSFKQTGTNLFLMLYPTVETFENSFSPLINGETSRCEMLGEDFVIGVRGPLIEDDYETVFLRMESILQQHFLNAEPALSPAAEL